MLLELGSTVAHIDDEKVAAILFKCGSLVRARENDDHKGIRRAMLSICLDIIELERNLGEKFVAIEAS